MSNFEPTLAHLKIWSDQRSKVDRASAAEWDHARVELIKAFGPASKEVRTFDFVRQNPDLSTYKRLMAHIRGPSFDGRVGHEPIQLLSRMRDVVLASVGFDPAARICIERRDTHEPLWPGPGWWPPHYANIYYDTLSSMEFDGQKRTALHSAVCEKLELEPRAPAGDGFEIMLRLMNQEKCIEQVQQIHHQDPQPWTDWLVRAR